jgi:hypothetical protein
VRTTLNIDEALLADAKRLAAERRTTVTALVEEALRVAVLRADEEIDRPAPQLPTFGAPGGGPFEDVNLDDSRDLRDRMEAGLVVDRRR